VSDYVDASGDPVVLMPLDVLLYRGSRLGVVSNGIRFFTWSQFTHGGVGFQAEGRNLVCDATWPKVDVRPVSADLRTGSRIKVMRMPTGCYADEFGMQAFAFEHWGVHPYGLGKMLANAFTEVFGRPDAKDPEGIPKGLFCSELASLCLRAFGRHPDRKPFDPCPELADRYTTPADLNRRSRLVTVCDELRLADEETP